MRTLCFIATLLALTLSCKKQKKITVELKHIDFPSASGIECIDGKIYIIGDDANDLLVLDTSLNNIDSIPLYSFPEKRIPKAVKADLEAMTVIPGNKLLLLGSGSLSPYRNTGWIIDPSTKQKDSIRLDTFYQRLLSYGIKEVNIEGIAAMPKAMVLSNRGNKASPKNHLIFTGEGFWKQQSEAKINTMIVGFSADTNSFNGVSGLTYATRSDALIMTISTEDTRNNVDDGAIGKSYLWIINNISIKRRWKAINPDRIIDLNKTDARFKGQKIESVCLLKETNKEYHLLLAADNDNGSSTLFKLVVPKQ